MGARKGEIMTDQDRRTITAKIRAKAHVARFEQLASRIAVQEDNAPGIAVEENVSVSYSVADRTEIPGQKL